MNVTITYYIHYIYILHSVHYITYYTQSLRDLNPLNHWYDFLMYKRSCPHFSTDMYNCCFGTTLTSTDLLHSHYV
jgi:hypothetical protein